jgi:ketosteroid isomerase-like protein
MKRVDIAAAEAEVRAVGEALRTAVNSGDVTGILACWEKDGVLQPPHHPAVRGHASLTAYFRNVFAARRLTFTFTGSAVTVLGEVALERVTYTAIAVAVTGHDKTTDVGKGLHIYGRQSDGSWKLRLDIWNSDLPP